MSVNVFLLLLVLLPLEGILLATVKGACYQGFLSPGDIPSERKDTVLGLFNNVPTTDYIYPDLRFHCNGTITSVYLGAFFSNRIDFQWGKVLRATVSVWRANGVNYLNAGHYEIVEDLTARSNRQGLINSAAHPNDAYYLISNSVLQVRKDVVIPVETGDIIGLSLLPDTRAWEDAIPVIALGGSANSYVLTEAPDATCWNADAEGYISCHTVTDTHQPAIAIDFQPQSTTVTVTDPVPVPVGSSATGSSTLGLMTMATTTTADLSTQALVQPSTTPSEAPVTQQHRNEVAIAVGVLGALLLAALVALCIVSCLLLYAVRVIKSAKTYKVRSDVVIASNPAYTSGTLANDCTSDDYATLHTASTIDETATMYRDGYESMGGNTLDGYIQVDSKYDVLQRDGDRSAKVSSTEVDESITSSVGGRMSYNAISSSVHYQNPSAEEGPYSTPVQRGISMNDSVAQISVSFVGTYVRCLDYSIAIILCNSTFLYYT